MPELPDPARHPNPSPAERRLEGRRARIAVASGCGLLGAALFAPAAGSRRLADDFVLLRTVRAATNVLWPFGHNDLGQPAGSGHFYRPLWVLWNAAIDQLSSGPVLAHLFNLLLFAFVCAEVVVLLARVADARAALIGGVLFAVYPRHGESVAWISGNTDLLAVALGLGAVMATLSRRPTATSRVLAGAALSALAMLVKEIAVVFPVLAVLLLWARDPDDRAGDVATRWRPVLAMAAAIGIVLIARAFVVEGFGGYGAQALTPRRALGSFVSFTVGGFSAPQLALLRHPALFLIPAALMGLAAVGVIRAWSAGDRARARLALAGLAWFVVALAPVLNEPLNLNTGNGSRLLLLPSVGLALTAGVLGSRLRPRRGAARAGAPGPGGAPGPAPGHATATANLAVASAAAGTAALAVCCVLNALDWRTAGDESRRLLAEIDRIAPANARLIALSIPTDYRAAHLYPDALDIAVQESGRPDVTLSGCMPVHVLTLRPRQISFHPITGGGWLGATTSSAPFDVPVLGGSGPQANASCEFGKAPNQPATTLGTALRALVTPRASADTPILVYFDGRDMRRVGPA